MDDLNQFIKKGFNHYQNFNIIHLIHLYFNTLIILLYIYYTIL